MSLVTRKAGASPALQELLFLFASVTRFVTVHLLLRLWEGWILHFASGLNGHEISLVRRNAGGHRNIELNPVFRGMAQKASGRGRNHGSL